MLFLLKEGLIRAGENDHRNHTPTEGWWWWSSGQRARLLLRVRIPLKPTVLFSVKLCLKRTKTNKKEAKVGPLFKPLSNRELLIFLRNRPARPTHHSKTVLQHLSNDAVESLPSHGVVGSMLRSTKEYFFAWQRRETCS